MSNPNITLSIASAQSITDPPVRTKVVRISEWYSSQSEGCNSFWREAALVVPSALLVLYLGFQARRSVKKLRHRKSYVMIAYYALLWLSALLNLAWALLQNLFATGTDSTPAQWNGAITELLPNPNILAQAQHELDSIVGKDRLVKGSDLARLTFLQAVIKENFRLHPSTPLSLPRIAQHSCEINGYFIPKHSNFSSTFGTSLVTQTNGPMHWSFGPMLM